MDQLISSFLEIDFGLTVDIARQYLQQTYWNLDEAIQLYLIGKEEGAPVWKQGYGNKYSTCIYRPPIDLMYDGPFEKAKEVGSEEKKWLLVNLQSKREFNSYKLNKDTWASEVVARTIKSDFIFCQVYDDTEECRKVCTNYKIELLPVILVINPLTGQRVRSWHGMVHPEDLVKNLKAFMYVKPSEYRSSEQQSQQQQALEAPKDTNEKSDDGKGKQLLMKPSLYPDLPKEPKKDNGKVLCRVFIRLPDGRQVQRNFLPTDSIKLLWSFCATKLEEAETRPFRFTRTRAREETKIFEYDSNLTFKESRLANSVISLSWKLTH